MGEYNYPLLPDSPLYDPKFKIRNFNPSEDYNQIRTYHNARRLFTDYGFLHDLGAVQEWRRPPEICRNPKFVDDKHSRHDALQGAEGDCWFVSSVIALSRHPAMVEFVAPPNQNFTDNYTGAFHFRFWRLGVWYDIVVDDRLPVWKGNQRLVYVHSRFGRNVFWAALLEKAYAKFYKMGSPFAYYNYLGGGWARTSLLDLTGGVVEYGDIGKVFPNTAELKRILTAAYDNDALICFACYKDPKVTKGIVVSHSYTLTKVWIGSGSAYGGLYLVRIMNPWGDAEWEGRWSDDDLNMWKQIDRNLREELEVPRHNDGEFWMDEEDLAKIFDDVNICFLNPGHYFMSHPIKKLLGGWKSISFKGEWVKGVSAGGSGRTTRHMNPQFKIEVDPVDSSVKYVDGETIKFSSPCTILIDLVHMSKRERRVTPDIAFYIYPLHSQHEVALPLDVTYLVFHDPLDTQPDFSSSEGRCYHKALNLMAGKYILIPCTKHENDESQFLLRVFAESLTNYWEYDNQLSKSFEVAETNLYNFDKDLYEAFNAVKEADDEIDWIGLKGILDEMFRKKFTKKGLFGYVMSFFRYIHDFFTQTASDNYDTDNVFSKEECRRMITMLDSDRSGKLDFSELSNLWNKINFWAEVYENHKNETGEYISVAQLRDALSAIGFKVNKRTIHSLSYRYADDQGQIVLTDFILCGITLETVLASSQKFENGKGINFSLEDWVKCTLNL